MFNAPLALIHFRSDRRARSEKAEARATLLPHSGRSGKERLESHRVCTESLRMHLKMPACALALSHRKRPAPQTSPATHGINVRARLDRDGSRQIADEICLPSIDRSTLRRAGTVLALPGVDAVVHAVHAQVDVGANASATSMRTA